ncbi:unnamed protein product, partial [Closterium sp. Naga37s-1]
DALASLAHEWNDMRGVSTWKRGEDCNSMDAVRCDGDGHVIALFITQCTLVDPLPTALLALSHLKNLDMRACFHLPRSLPRSLPDTLGSLSSPMGL